MADWPTVEELLLQLGVTQALEELPEPKQLTINRGLAAAIEQVQIDTVGLPAEAVPPDIPPGDPVVPTSSQAAAALLLAVRVTKAPDAPFGVAAVFDAGGIYKAVNDPDYRRLLKGSRSRFGVA